MSVIFLPLGKLFFSLLISVLAILKRKSWVFWQGVHKITSQPESAVLMGIVIKNISLNHFTNQKAPNQTQK